MKRPPDMSIFLQEERRLEKLLYRQSICSESDSTQGESRDSGVELDRNLMDEHSWITDDAHSRQNSEVIDIFLAPFSLIHFRTRVGYICSLYVLV